MIFAFIGSIIALALLNPLVNLFGGNVAGQEHKAWQLAVAVFAVLAVILFWLTFSWTHERIQPIKKEKTKLSTDLKDLFENRPWWILLGSGIAALIFNSIRDGAAIYYFKYFIQDQKLTSLYLVLGQAFNIVGILLITPLANKIGKKAAYLYAMVIAAVFSIAFYWLGKDNIYLIFAFQCIISACAGSIFPLLWSMYADIADYSEWKTGRRATGLVFSSSSMSQKFGWTLGGALTGWLLAFYGYKANVVQSTDVQTGIRMMLSIFPAIGTFLSIFFISIYPLNEKKMKEISAKLSEQRESNLQSK
jgi:GPH family glycoside/pentoside/hexuronide:cation symporter